MDEELDFVQPHKKIEVNLVPCEDAIRRTAVRDLICRNNDKYGYSDRFHEFTEECLNLPPVTVQTSKEDIHREREQAYMRGYEDASRKYRIEPCTDAISRQAALNAMYSLCGDGTLKENEWRDNPHIDSIIDALKDLPSVSTEKTRRCRDCKYFEYDSVATVDGIPLIVAHEICSKWGDGCKTREDGYCFLFEPQESEDKE